jgi:hypothetical protein
MALPVRHVLATTAKARAAAAGGLLPYRLRMAAADELLHGGVRLRGLVANPPAVEMTQSHKLRLPTLQDERADMEFDWWAVQHLLTPGNLHLEVRNEFARIKNADLYSRHLRLPRTQPPSRVLTVAPTRPPFAVPHATQGPTGARSIYDTRTFVPLQSIKPLGSAGVGSLASRGRGLRPFSAAQRQERLSGRGYGEKKNLHKFPTFHGDTVGFRPRRGY